MTNRGEKTAAIGSTKGLMSPFSHPFAQGQAHGGPQDVPSGQAQQGFAEHARLAAHAQAPQAGAALDAADS